MQKSFRCWKDPSRSGQVNLLHVFKRPSQELHVLCFACFPRKRNPLFIWVSEVIINICAIIAFMIQQHEIKNFYCFTYLIRTFTENALKFTRDRDIKQIDRMASHNACNVRDLVFKKFSHILKTK